MVGWGNGVKLRNCLIYFVSLDSIAIALYHAAIRARATSYVAIALPLAIRARATSYVAIALPRSNTSKSYLKRSNNTTTQQYEQ